MFDCDHLIVVRDVLSPDDVKFFLGNAPEKQATSIALTLSLEFSLPITSNQLVEELHRSHQLHSILSPHALYFPMSELR